MQLHGLSERTQEAYARAVRQLSDHYQKSPAQISEEELRGYFLHNKNIRKWSRAASSISICGIKFFYQNTLKKDWPSIKLVRPVQEKSLPPILSLGEVRGILVQVKMPYHRVCLTTIYSLGLRLGEGAQLQVSDIDSERMFVHIHRGKGNKDRYIPLPERTLQILREHWKSHRNPKLLFPAPGRGGIGMSTTDLVLPKTSIQMAFKAACKGAKIIKAVSVHHLRHAYAVHLLEAGVNLRFVQEYLGHSDPRTTMRYTLLINKQHSSPVKILNEVMSDLR